ncbi:glycoside hydrolase family 88 protein [Clostridium massiliodielmoense]|uniref:glycoside hydrolase family 88 protein n=1 Tax=Clostridium massiliodielmoense TaxID=1776385 RepID=UPI000166A0C1|nr:glycoside hydrolase family 88 protein [Clostridium massiliodielmoense]EDS77405.1 unsaturated glucuronyl hydrolase [Clostridium botulinum C str. Eklund]KEH98672.1 glucuronyl hydrolase [Clostridium botulinum C/D str. BKT12695]NEZ49883.1 glucuronyl hydrolase [Clostridium botulinum]
MKNVAIEEIKNSQKFMNTKLLSKEEVENAIKDAIEVTEKNMKKFGDKGKYPSSCCKSNKYDVIDNSEWTTGFWPGILWLSYEYTQDEKFKKLAEEDIQSFKERLENDYALGHHDLGFLYNLSCISAYKLTGNEEARKIAINAADYLMGRFQEKGQFIQAWGELGAEDNYRLIIDCLLNIPLLYWAAKQTGDSKYFHIAYTHYKTSCDTVIREDGSSFHTFYFDKETGKPTKGVTKQGYSDDSSWARGQAWGVYGIPLTYRATKDPDAIKIYEAVTNYFLNRLPKDNVCYWDLIFNDGDDHVRDSSAAAIAVCGMHEMQKYLPETNEYKQVYKYAMHAILRSLIENYATKKDSDSDALLLHGVYGWHANNGVDEGNTWGDYYYLEALMRFYKDWELYC